MSFTTSPFIKGKVTSEKEIEKELNKSLARWASLISNDDPLQCFGGNMEVFERLQSSEW